MPRRNSAVRVLELAAAAPAVIALRTARVIAAGATPTTADRLEMSRMVDEKIDAFGRSWWAMAARQQQAAFETWLAIARLWASPWMQPFLPPRTTAGARREMKALQRRMTRSQAAVFAAGLAPLHRAATANLRRLSRPGSRRR